MPMWEWSNGMRTEVYQVGSCCWNSLQHFAKTTYCPHQEKVWAPGSACISSVERAHLFTIYPCGVLGGCKKILEPYSMFEVGYWTMQCGHFNRDGLDRTKQNMTRRWNIGEFGKFGEIRHANMNVVKNLLEEFKGMAWYDMCFIPRIRICVVEIWGTKKKNASWLAMTWSLPEHMGCPEDMSSCCVVVWHSTASKGGVRRMCHSKTDWVSVYCQLGIKCTWHMKGNQ